VRRRKQQGRQATCGLHAGKQQHCVQGMKAVKAGWVLGRIAAAVPQAPCCAWCRLAAGWQAMPNAQQIHLQTQTALLAGWQLL
jgi:hypothetical protein